MINSLHCKCFSGLLPWWYRGDVIYPVNNYSFLASVIKHFIGSETAWCLLNTPQILLLTALVFVQERSTEIIFLLIFLRRLAFSLTQHLFDFLIQSIHPEKVCMYKQLYLRIIRNAINSKPSSFCFPFSSRNHNPLFLLT